MRLEHCILFVNYWKVDEHLTKNQICNIKKNKGPNMQKKTLGIKNKNAINTIFEMYKKKKLK